MMTNKGKKERKKKKRGRRERGEHISNNASPILCNLVYKKKKRFNMVTTEFNLLLLFKQKNI